VSESGAGSSAAAYRLDVCVPTYNREPYLRQLLAAFARQADARLQLVISDNASTDGTARLVEDFAAGHTWVTYVRAAENAGPDRNYLRSMAAADADFCWLFGSDDLPVQDAVARVLSALAEEPDILLVDRMWCDVRMQPLRRDHLFSPGHLRFDTHDPAQARAYLEAAHTIMAMFSYLSSIVVRATRWEEADRAEEFVGSAYVHSARLLSVVRDGALLAYLPRALVACRGDNDFFLQSGEFRRAKLDFDGYQRLIDTYLPEPALHAAGLGVMRREYGAARILLVAAGATRPELEELAAYLDYYAYPGGTRLALKVVARPAVHALLATAARPARRAWWWYHRAARRRLTFT
jgi:abequosyltransferase